MEQHQYESAVYALSVLRSRVPKVFEELKTARWKYEKRAIINFIRDEMKLDIVPKGVIKNAIKLLEEKYL